MYLKKLFNNWNSDSEYSLFSISNQTGGFEIRLALRILRCAASGRLKRRKLTNLCVELGAKIRGSCDSEDLEDSQDFAAEARAGAELRGKNPTRNGEQFARGRASHSWIFHERQDGWMAAMAVRQPRRQAGWQLRVLASDVLANEEKCRETHPVGRGTGSGIGIGNGGDCGSVAEWLWNIGSRKIAFLPPLQWQWLRKQRLWILANACAAGFQ